MKRLSLSCRFPVLLWSAVALYLPLVIAGCGGNHSSLSNPSDRVNGSRGRATVSVRWPQPSRLIPVAANSLRIEIRDGSGVLVGSQLLPRLAQGGTATASFDPLPLGNLTAQATAFPNVDGTGVAQATGSTPLLIQAGQTTSFRIAPLSTINRIELTPAAPAALPVGQSITFSATAKDAQGDIVLTAPNTLQWSSSNGTIATVTDGQVTAVSGGSAQITVIETESGRQSSTSIVVPSPAPVSWWKAEGNAQDAVGANHASLQNGTAFGAGIEGQAFLFDGVNDAISVPDNDSLKITGSLTIDARIYMTARPTQQLFAMILFRGDDRSALDPYFLGARNDGKLYFHVESLTESAEINAPQPPLNQWVRVTATLDNATGQMRLYYDGNLVAEATTTVRPFRDMDSGRLPGIGIGNHGRVPNSFYNYPFAGRIDELKIYNQVVPPTP